MRLNARWMIAAGCLLGAVSSPAQSLVGNGAFDAPGDGLKGWNVDYAWTGNSHYTNNSARVSVVAAESGKTKVVRLESEGGAGTKMESALIPFEPGYRYTGTLDVKGGPYRVYFAGYQWTPGVRPHDNPALGELRLVYKGKATAAESGAWKQEKIELPGVKLTPQAMESLQRVRFITAYIWMMKTGFVDNVTVKKTLDPSVKF